MKNKLSILLLIFSSSCAVRFGMDYYLQPVITTSRALHAASGDCHTFLLTRAFHAFYQSTDFILSMIMIGCAILFFAACWKQNIVLLAALSGCLITSCKPFDTPEYNQVGNNETAFLIPLEDAIEKQDQQVKFDSEAFLNDRKVLAKRIQIPHRWEPMGRMWFTGSWLPTAVVLKVDRSPVTRQWTSNSSRTKGMDQAIWIESADSVGFSMGVSCTAFITEQNSAKFLYMYPSGSLSDVMDSEIRARIQKVAAEQAARYKLDELRDKKAEIMAALDKDLVPFFAERGITITTIGMFGGMTYENPKIQEAIDEVFIAQQKKNVALAEYEAQSKVNETTLLAAEAAAKQTQVKAAAEAERKSLEAEAEAKAIRSVNDALAGSSPVLLQLRALETQAKQLERWDGKLPVNYMGGLEHPQLLLQLPK